MCEVRDNSFSERVSDIHHHNGNPGRGMFRGSRRLIRRRHDDVHLQAYQLGHEIGVSIEPSLGKTTLDDDVLAFDKSALTQSIEESLTGGLRRDRRIIRQETDAIDFASLLRTRRARPSRSRAAEQRYELAPLHSITSSARASSVDGTSTPSALAVCRLMTSSNVVACMTGRSAGFSPLRMRPV